MFLKKFSIFVVFVALIIISFKKGYQYYFKSLYPTSYPTSIASENIRLDGEMIVPKVFHRIWLIWDTKNPDMPEVYKDFDKILKNLHPDWQFVEWDDKKVEEFIKKYYPDFWNIYSNYDQPTKKHDASRYLILNHFGGVFIQHSIKLCKNIEPLLKGYDAVFSEESVSTNIIAAGFFASTANNPILKDMIKELYIMPNKLGPLSAGGPHKLTKVIRNYINKNGNKRNFYSSSQIFLSI